MSGVERISIEDIESLVEANVQRTLDTLDAWKLAAPFKVQDGSVQCTRERHVCDLNGSAGKICVGCTLYSRIVMNRDSFQVGGRSEVCDYLASGIADPLIFAFIKNGDWLRPMAKLTGSWFVKHPITFHSRRPTSLVAVSQVSVRRNKIRIFGADELLKSMRFSDTSIAETLSIMPYYHTTEAGGKIYSLDDLLDVFEPVGNVVSSLARIGINTTLEIEDGIRKGLIDLRAKGL